VKILHLSDTHCQQNKINIPSDIDIIIHSGDFSNKKDSLRNEKEALAFIDWFSSLDIKYKVLVAGNHDTSIQARLITPEQIEKSGKEICLPTPVLIKSFNILPSNALAIL